MAWQLLRTKEEYDKLIESVKEQGGRPTYYYPERFPCLADYVWGKNDQGQFEIAHFVFVYDHDARELLTEVEKPVTQTKRKIPHGLALGQVG